MGIDFTHVNGARGDEVDAGDDGRRRRGPRLRRRRKARSPLRLRRLLAGRSARRGSQKSSLALYRTTASSDDGLPHFRDVTREAGLERVFYGMGASVADYDDDGRDDVYVTAPRPQLPLPQPRRTFRGGRREGRRRRLGLGNLVRLARLRRRRTARPLRLPLRRLDAEEGSLLHARRQDQVLLHARALPGNAVAPLPQSRRRPLRGRRRRRRASTTPTRRRSASRRTTSTATAGSTSSSPTTPRRTTSTATRAADVSRTSASRRASRWTRRAARAARWAWRGATRRTDTGATLAIGNFSNELKSLYWTDKGDVFLDESPRSGVGPSSLLSLTFGVFFFDADLDGRLDLLLANGHVEPTVQEVQKDVTYEAGADPLLERGRRAVPALGRSAAISTRRWWRAAPRTRISTATATSTSSSSSNGGPARVYLNRTDKPNASVRVKLAGARPGQPRRDRSARHRDGRRADTSCEVSGGQSYLSAPEKTLTFGLGGASKIDKLEIRWPDGATQTVTDVAGGARLTVAEHR